MEMVEEALIIVREAIEYSHPANAWKLLQEYDNDGNAQGPLPYTDEAIIEFTRAYNYYPGDSGVVHHLAIAHHARAWDFEIQRDSRASEEWKRALGFWRTLVNSGEFWTCMKNKLSACDPDIDPSMIDQARMNLLENLLDIHVDFICHYCECEEQERAVDHKEIIMRARIPPAVRKKLIKRVFQVMTEPVPQAKASREYISALTIVERFLELFPDYLSALRMHADICIDWVREMSYQDNWDDILKLGERALPYVTSLEAHSELEDDPMARLALVELIKEFVERSRDRGARHMCMGESGEISVPERDRARSSFKFGIKWGRMGYRHTSCGSDLRSYLSDCLQFHIMCLQLEARDVNEANKELRLMLTTIQLEARDVSEANKEYRLMLTTIQQLHQSSFEDIEEAMEVSPTDNSLKETHKKIRNDLDDIESAITNLSLFGDRGWIS